MSRLHDIKRKEQADTNTASRSHTEADAARLVDTVDHERAAFIKNYFHAECPDRSLYHAMINTDIGDEMVVRAMLSFLDLNQPGEVAAD